MRPRPRAEEEKRWPSCSCVSPPSRPNDPRRDEDQELVVLFRARLVAEQVSEDRDLPETRDHVVLVLVVQLEDASDDRRAAVSHEDLALVLANRQGHVLAECEVQG